MRRPPLLTLAAFLTVVTFMGCQAGTTQDNVRPETNSDALVASDTVRDLQPAQPQERVVKVPPVSELLGNVLPANDSAFAELPPRVASQSGLYLRTEARDAFIRMYDAAQVDGLTLTALSATRPFSHQAAIWNRKWNRPQAMGMAPLERARDILRYSSMPGTSRHHWGTDVDIYSLEPSDFDAGEGARVVAWLRTHAGRFGFVEVYTAEATRPGYQPEAWHWSYLPLAGPFLDALNESHKRGDLPKLDGFEGAFIADSLRILEDYINGINPALSE